MAKTIISLSKVDIEAKNIYKSRPIKTTSLMNKEAKRSASGFDLRKNKDNASESKQHSKMHFEGAGSVLKHGLRDIK
jgi:hypothetical protein